MRLRLIVLVGSILCAWPATAAPVLSIVPSSTNVDVGDTFSVEISVSDAADLFGFQFDVGFNPGVLEALSIAEGPFLAIGGATVFIPGGLDNVGGAVTSTGGALVGAISGVDGNGVLATLTFSAIGAGTSSVTLFNVALLDSSFSTVAATVQNGSVNSTGTGPAPEPVSLLLWGTVAGVGVHRVRAAQKKLPSRM